MPLNIVENVLFTVLNSRLTICAWFVFLDAKLKWFEMLRFLENVLSFWLLVSCLVEEWWVCVCNGGTQSTVVMRTKCESSLILLLELDKVQVNLLQHDTHTHTNCKQNTLNIELDRYNNSKNKSQFSISSASFFTIHLPMKSQMKYIRQCENTAKCEVYTTTEPNLIKSIFIDL